jgi:hypothetical protein
MEQLETTNLTALLDEAQAHLEPLCEAAGVPQPSCTLHHALLALVAGVLILRYSLRSPAAAPAKRKTSSESDDEAEAAAAKLLHRPSRPPERYVDSETDDEEEHSEAAGGEAAADGGDGEEKETEEGLRERRRAITDGRAARMKEAIDELTALHCSDNVAEICDALRKHAGKPADCRPAWLQLQKRLRTLVGDDGGGGGGGDAGGSDTTSVAAPAVGVAVEEENPACVETDGSSS